MGYTVLSQIVHDGPGAISNLQLVDPNFEF